MPRRESAGHGWLTVTLVLIAVLALPATAVADGGPILTDPQLWAMLKEGQQTAVVRLGDSNKADVDLFISMLDESGQSHQVVFFVPLGSESSRFRVVEETSRQFDEQVTSTLDNIFRQELERRSAYKTSVRWSLLLGTLLINGEWSWPVWLVWLLSSCGVAGAPTPMATYETPSSQVAIYSVEEGTDLQALIRTTGLDPAVRGTLSRLTGQQIAIVTLHTQPLPNEGGQSGGLGGQPGLHLAWATTLSSQSSTASYAYPLGTGRAWARPIELTRVYVVAPPGVDFGAQYPRLGPDLSGYTLGAWSSRSAPRIMGAAGPAYAVEDAIGDFGRVWRVTYKESNSSEDLIITRLPEMSARTRATLRRQGLERPVAAFSWLLAPVVALAVWLAAWRYVMRHFLGVDYQWRDPRFWAEAVAWALLYPLTNGLALVGGLVLAIVSAGVGLVVALPLLLVTALGTISIFFFARNRARALGVSRRRAALAYIVVMLLANAIYLPFGAAYLALVGA